MSATVTLSTTTLGSQAKAGESEIKVASTTGLVPGVRLFVDRELMSVVGLLVDPWVKVLRGVDGTAASVHSTGATVTIGDADQFYASDPTGSPPEVIPVSPYINVTTGDFWFAQGDELPVGETNRWWQKQATTRTTGFLGVRTTTQDPAS